MIDYSAFNNPGIFEQDPDVEGTVEHIVFRNPDNGFTIIKVFDMKTYHLIHAVGTLPNVAPGETILLWGDWKQHPEYGTELLVAGYQKELPDAIESILKYLTSKTLKGLSPTCAVQVVNRYGLQTFDVIEFHPEWLTDIPGITKKKAKMIHESFMEQANMRDLLVMCTGILKPQTITRIYDLYGNESKNILKTDPYCLCRDLNGISFEKADEIAIHLGMEQDSAIRMEAGTRHILLYNAQMNGHVCLPYETLVNATSSLLHVEKEHYETYLKEALQKGKFTLFATGGANYVFLNETNKEETYVAKKILELKSSPIPLQKDVVARMIEEIEHMWNIDYDVEQLKAINLAQEKGVMILTGGPGTGKTTVIRALIYMFDLLGLSVALAAPTGRAAKRMSDATIREAKTIHRLLEVTMDENTGKHYFMRNESNPIDEKVVIIDEVSMMDLPLMAALLKGIRRGTRLILIGDSNQLPSVGAGNILHDLLSSKKIPSIELNTVFRQSEESLIVHNAHLIEQGQMPVLDDVTKDFFYMRRENDEEISRTVCSLILERLPKTYGDQVIQNLQIICPTRKGNAGTEQLNRALQEALNPKDQSKKEFERGTVIFREGDRVMQTRNRYEIEWNRHGKEGMGIFNGDMGIIQSIDRSMEQVHISFDDRIAVVSFTQMEDVEHAYAITVHKSQGNEYDTVILSLGSSGELLQTRNLLYTAITRAKTRMIVVGRKSVLETMVRNNKEDHRYTCLVERMNKML